MLALADESSRTSGGGLYLMAEVMIPAERTVEVRAHLRGLLPPGQRRFHWRSDNDRLRMRMLEAIDHAALHAAVFIKKPTAGSSQRRCRALCLEGVLWYLKEQRISELIIESRLSQDQDDRPPLGGAGPLATRRDRQRGFDVRGGTL